jgi:hypothetical protein
MESNVDIVTSKTQVDHFWSDTGSFFCNGYGYNSYILLYMFHFVNRVSILGYIVG